MTRAITTVCLLFTLCACSGSAPRAATDGSAGAASASASSSSSPSRATAGSALPTGDATESPSAGVHQTTAQERALAPASGTYTYAQSGSFTSASGSQTIPDRGTLVAHAPTRAGGGVEQVQERIVSEHNKSTYTYRFTERDVSIVRVDSQGFTCTLTAPLRVFSFPIAAGQRWTSSAACREASSVSFTVEEQVLRAERRVVGGSTIDTFVVRSHIDVNAGAFSQKQDATTWVAPARRLIVHSTTHITSSLGSGDITEDLLGLSPAR